MAALVYIVVLNIMVVGRYADQLMMLNDNYHRLFLRTFHISGFDPLSYEVLSQWTTAYNIYRHPLLAFIMFVPNQINQGLILLTGLNWAPVIMAFILVFCAFYAFVFLCRIFREVVGLGWTDAWLLGSLTYSFAYVMLSACVPDHFIISMFMLVLTLYVAGRAIRRRRAMKPWVSVVLFIATAGISLNNGVKVFLASLFAGGKRFWRPAHLLLVVALPAAVMWGVARWEWHVFERPKYIARQEAKAKAKQHRHDAVARAFRDTTTLTDEARIAAAIDTLVAQKERQREEKNAQKAYRRNIGQPIAHGEFSQWTDITTPRWPSIVENLFGESIQLHADHLLEDNLSTRPVIVHYRLHLNYVAELILVALFVVGVWCGRRHRFMWLALSFWGFDMLIHVVLGFGLNEVYIMGAHWLFVVPIAIGYLFRATRRNRLCMPVRLLVLTQAIFFAIWNLSLFTAYLYI